MLIYWRPKRAKNVKLRSNEKKNMANYSYQIFQVSNIHLMFVHINHTFIFYIYDVYVRAKQ